MPLWYQSHHQYSPPTPTPIPIPIPIPVSSPSVDMSSDFELGWEVVVSIGIGSSVLTGSIVLTEPGKHSRYKAISETARTI